MGFWTGIEVSTRKANDWWVMPFIDIHGGAAVGAGYWTMFFASPSLKERFGVRFAGFGLAGGIHWHNPVSEIAHKLPGMAVPHWKKIVCDCSFSADDLDSAWGRITAAGVGFGFGYHAMFLSAFTMSQGSLFTSQGIAGWEVRGGVAAGGVTTAGAWEVLEVNEYDSELEAHLAGAGH